MIHFEGKPPKWNSKFLKVEHPLLMALSNRTKSFRYRFASYKLRLTKSRQMLVCKIAAHVQCIKQTWTKCSQSQQSKITQHLTKIHADKNWIYLLPSLVSSVNPVASHYALAATRSFSFPSLTSCTAALMSTSLHILSFLPALRCLLLAILWIHR